MARRTGTGRAGASLARSTRATSAPASTGSGYVGSLRTSEAVCRGHPDKLCDQVSDSILDACLEQDPMSRVACEAATKSSLIMLLGEITSLAHVDYTAVARRAIIEAGYDSPATCFDGNTCGVLVALEHQSADIEAAVASEHGEEDLGAGDQGLMYGYATDESEAWGLSNMMPLSHTLASNLCQKLEECRSSKRLPFLQPDGKAQITMSVNEHDGRIMPHRIDSVIVSAQHTEEVDHAELQEALMEEIVRPTLPDDLLDEDTRYLLNAAGRFVVGGPHADAGLTGRKIIVDSYGGWCSHGGGAYSGKDSSKVDRSAAYAARWVAKSLVAAGLCHRALVQLSFAIGQKLPSSVAVHSYGTSELSDAELGWIIEDNFDLRVSSIIRDLGLRRPIFHATSYHGHFGREGDNGSFLWETPKPLK